MQSRLLGLEKKYHDACSETIRFIQLNREQRACESIDWARSFFEKHTCGRPKGWTFPQALHQLQAGKIAFALQVEAFACMATATKWGTGIVCAWSRRLEDDDRIASEHSLLRRRITIMAWAR